MNQPKILVVDDDKEIVGAIKKRLEMEDYEIITAYDGLEAMDILMEQEVQLLIIDVMMPKMNGVDVLRRLREEGVKTPVMMLTAKTQKDDRITGFNAGADDYLPKPFEPDELICRVRAMLRRGGGYTPDILTFGDVSLDTSSGMMTGSGGSVRLSGREFQLMEMFMRSPGVVFSADRIMEKIWGWDSDAEINVVWVHISNLRKKLRSIGSDVSVHASRGLGYMLEKQ